MNFIIIVPNVVRRYIASLPEVTNNAYGYFNYDNRVVNERVQRFDAPSTYRGPNSFNDMEYDSLVSFAQQNINQGLAKYSAQVACEDALSLAIKSFNNGMFDGKINANKYNVLLAALTEKITTKQAAAKKKEPVLQEHHLRDLGLKRKDIPQAHRVRNVPKGVKQIVQEHGRVKIKEKN